MRWFKHISMSHHDQILSELMDEFGAEGYGVWWIILEKIAQQLNEKSSTSLRLSLKVWATSARVSTKKFQNIVKFLEKNKTFSLNFEEKYLTIECKNLIKYKDEYTEKRIKKSGESPDKIPTKSGQTPEQEAEAELETETELEKESNYLASANNSVREESATERIAEADAQKKNTIPPPPNQWQEVTDFFLERFPTLWQGIGEVLTFWSGKKARAMLGKWREENVCLEDIKAAVEHCEHRGNVAETPIYFAKPVIDFARERQNLGSYSGKTNKKPKETRDEEMVRISNEAVALMEENERRKLTNGVQ